MIYTELLCLQTIFKVELDRVNSVVETASHSEERHLVQTELFVWLPQALFEVLWVTELASVGLFAA